MQWLMLWPLCILGSKQVWTLFLLNVLQLYWFSLALLEWFGKNWFQKYERTDLRESSKTWTNNVSAYLHSTVYCKLNFVDSDSQLDIFICLFLKVKISVKKILPLPWGKSSLHLGPWNGMWCFFLSKLVRLGCRLFFCKENTHWNSFSTLCIAM